MKLSSLPLLGLAAAATGRPAVHPHAGNGYESTDFCCETVQCKQDALAFAYTYGFPLYAYGAITAGEEGELPTNSLNHQRQLQSSSSKNVVRPNADTLYSTVFFDLSANDLEITLPEYSDRYGNCPFYDLYGNNFANIGSIANITSGKFLLRYDQNNIGIVTEDVEGDYDGYVGMPTPYGMALIRVVVTNTTEDLDVVHQYQDQMSITVVPRNETPVAPALDLNMFKNSSFQPVDKSAASIAEAILRLTAALAPYNEPEVAQDRTWVAQALENAGMQNGTWTQPPGTNLTAAVQASNDAVADLLSSPGYMEQLTNNWTAYDPRIVGDFQSYYQARLKLTEWAYLITVQDQAMYPFYPGLDEIAADKAILFQFSGRPAVKEKGFWSITLYGADEFFVDNELGRFAVGDRSNITFPDGNLVYPTAGEETPDGPFEILLQPADVEPPQNWTSNWLPAPAGGGSFSFTIRWYGPEDALFEGGSYVYPKVSVIDALLA